MTPGERGEARRARGAAARPRARGPRPSRARAGSRPRRRTPASDSKGSVPSSKRSGTSSEDGRELVRAPASPGTRGRRRGCRRAGRTTCTREQASTSNGARVEAAVRRGVDGVDVDARAGGAGGGGDAGAGRGSSRPRWRRRSRRPSACGRSAPPRRRDAGSSSVSGTGSAKRTVAPARSAAITHGRTLASWSRRVQTISSPGRLARPSRAKRIVSAVMLGPKTTPRGSAPSSAPTSRARAATTASVACAAAKAPPWLALRPGAHEVRHRLDRARRPSACRPGPSRRAQPPRRPGKRSRFTRSSRRVERVAVAVVGQQRARLVGGEPAHLVDLVVGLEAGTSSRSISQ